MDKIILTIDGKIVEANPDETVIEAAKRAGIIIPYLCNHEELEPFGGCRICIVEIEGMKGFQTSCNTFVKNGMSIKTNTPEIISYRKNIIKLLLSNHTSPCIVCLHRELCEKYRPKPTKTGKTIRCNTCSNTDICELKKLVKEYNIDDIGLPVIYNNIPLERRDPFMDRDYNLCILCGRCVRVCQNLHKKPFIAFINRGRAARIGTAFYQDHTETGCLFCGACVDICTTGALSDRYAKWYGKEDKIKETICDLCSINCDFYLRIKDNKVIGAMAKSFKQEHKICIGARFILPQLFESPKRITSNYIKLQDGIRKVPWTDAVKHAAAKLLNYKGNQFATIIYYNALIEEIDILKNFTKNVMNSENCHVVEKQDDKIKLNQETKAVITTGDYIDKDSLKNLEVIIALDVFPSFMSESADVLFALTLPQETGEALVPPPDSNTVSRIICDIAKEMGAQLDSYIVRSVQFAQNFNSTIWRQKPSYRNLAGGTATLEDRRQEMPLSSPLEDIKDLPRYYRGHYLADILGALRTIMKIERQEDITKKTEFKIVEKQEIVPNFHTITIQAPDIAKKCKPGQFVIAMVNDKSERIPYTIADWNVEHGTVTLIVQEVGRSSREMVMLSAGDTLAHFVGPLGNPVSIKRYGTVVCGGGCFGVGAILPICRELKKAGNRVISIIEASTHYLLYREDKIAEYSDKLLIATKDGSYGIKGGVGEAITLLAEQGETIDQVFIVGCAFMMMLVSESTKNLGIPTMTALNSIMMDGTGMCGACRVSVGDQTKFVCVDGTFLDGHKINWLELMQRLNAYNLEEIKSLPQDHSICH
ncbi:MAG: sulfide/dihydroorotate dehydrogenase-like FAD/NAD-binding protein [Candidatus Hydrogenedentota bacterium]